MIELVQRDYERLLDLAVSLVESLNSPEPWPAVAAELVGIMRADIAGQVDVQARGIITRRQMWPAWTDNVVWDEALVAAHPFVRHYGQHSDTVPRTVDELICRRDWLNSAVYRRAHADLRGATQQIAIPLSGADGTFASVTIGRAGAGFDDHQRLLAGRMQPVLIGLDRHLRATGRWRDNAPLGATAAAVAFLLTAREVAVLALMAQGLTADAIGRRLRIATGTVSKHQQHIYRKLGTRDRLSTVLYAREIGILPRPA